MRRNRRRPGRRRSCPEAQGPRDYRQGDVWVVHRVARAWNVEDVGETFRELLDSRRELVAELCNAILIGHDDSTPEQRARALLSVAKPQSSAWERGGLGQDHRAIFRVAQRSFSHPRLNNDLDPVLFVLDARHRRPVLRPLFDPHTSLLCPTAHRAFDELQAINAQARSTADCIAPLRLLGVVSSTERS